MSTLFRNVANQSLLVFAYDKTTGEPKTGDAANISCQVTLEPGTGVAAATNDAAPTEIEATDHPGWYLFDLTQAETNADVILFSPVSSSTSILIDDVLVYTQPKLLTFCSASGSPSTTSVPTDLSETTDDHFNGMFAMFLTGPCAGQSSKITDYNGTTKTLTVEALTDNPASGDQMVILGGTPQ